MPARHRLILVLLVLLALAGLFRLRIDVDILNVLPSGNRVARGLAEYQENFLQSGELIVVLRSPGPETTLAAVTSIVAAARSATGLVERVFWQPPSNESIAGAARFLAYLWLNTSTSAVRELAGSLSGTNLPLTLESSRERIATSLNPKDLFLLPRDPLNLSRVAADASETSETPEKFFASPDGSLRLIYLYAAVPLRNYEQCHVWVGEIRRMIDSALSPGQPSVEVLLTGRPVFVDEISSGMRSDMSTAVPGTLFLIGILFYLLHREWISLLLLLGILFVVMVWTALAGAAVLGQLNVISLGFASILLGLAEDFGIVLHQELKVHPHASAAALRKIAGPGIFWSALTTAAAFALLNLSALPGLRDLGTLVALGVVIGAWAMLYIFLPLLIRYRPPAPPSTGVPSSSARAPRRGVALSATVVLLLASSALLAVKPPRLDPSPDALRPRQSEASAALRLVQENIGVEGDPYWLVIHGSSVAEVRSRLERLDQHLSSPSSLGLSSVTLPLEIWPDPAAQRANLPVLQSIARDQGAIFAAIQSQGFTADALELSRVVFSQWAAFQPGVPNWPQGRVADWILPKFVSRQETNFAALGLVTPAANFHPAEVVPAALSDSVLLSGWSLLGKSVLAQVQREIPMISGLVALSILVALWLAFRRVSAVLLSVASLIFSGVLLLGMMSLLGWRWNLINLTALPLLLGMGIDYSIHMQNALDRFPGDPASAFQSIGRALLLAGATTIIGFTFLGFSSNLGMASLGRVCALGLSILLLNSVFLLPAWRSWIRGEGRWSCP